MPVLKIKIIVASIFSNPLIGKLIAIAKNNRFSRNGAQYVLDSPWISNRIKALIFWNLYENAEIEFVKKFLSGDYPVIELGSSLGIVSAVIGKKIGSQTLISIEANPDLIPIIEEHLRMNKGSDFEVIHAAIGNKTELFFQKGNDNTVGTVSDIGGSNAISVPVKALGNILEEKDIQSYSLVSDIEGAEVNFIFEDRSALDSCKELLIELHDNKRNGVVITVEEQIQQLILIGFDIVAKHGPVIFAKK